MFLGSDKQFEGYVRLFIKTVEMSFYKKWLKIDEDYKRKRYKTIRTGLKQEKYKNDVRDLSVSGKPKDDDDEVKSVERKKCRENQMHKLTGCQ